MISRREFIEAAAISALPSLAVAAPRAGGAQGSAQSATALRVVIDERFVQARTVGARLAALGATVHAIAEGDVTRAWLCHIGPAWKARAVTLAGLTARPALFCLEQLGLSCGLRVVFHAEHIVHREGRCKHEILRGAQLAGVTVDDLTLAGPLWPGRIAGVLATHAERSRNERYGLSAAALAPALRPGTRLLTSWIISAT